MSVQTRSYHDYRSDMQRVKCQCSDCGNAWEVTPFDRKDCPKCHERKEQAGKRALAGTFSVLSSLTDADCIL